MHWLKDFLYFVGVTVVFRFLFMNWLATKIVDLSERLTIALEHRLVKTEPEAVTWLHFKLRAQEKGHSSKHPRDCSDGRCIEITN